LRLMMVGSLDGRLAAATRIAAANGVPVRHADGVDTAIAMLGSGAADLLLADVATDIVSLAARLEVARVQAPVVACGAAGDAATAVAAARAGAKEYIPMPDDPVVIAAILAAVADDDALEPQASCPSELGEAGGTPAVEVSRKGGREGDAMAKVALAAETVTRALVGRTVADVERDLILATLARCLGNRTHAACLAFRSARCATSSLSTRRKASACRRRTMEKCVAPRDERPARDAAAWEITANQPDFHCCRAAAGAQSPRTVSAIRGFCQFRRSHVGEVMP
jgi:CheY-like chemotaxis protein